jgi:PilZ domain
MSYMNSKFRTVASALVDQRTAVRHPVQVQRATVRRHAAQAISALLEDISVYGCRVVVDGRFNPGDRLWLRLASSDPVPATAIWYDKGRLGCRFDGPLERKLLRDLTLGSDANC